MECFLPTGVSVRSHHLNGLYELVGMDEKFDNQVVCTLSHHIYDDTPKFNTKFKAHADESDASPICNLTFACNTGSGTLRHWNPYECTIAAALRCGLIHFPIESGTCLFVLNGLLSSLSHFADIVGSTGQLICVMSEKFAMRPSPESLSKFMRRHTNSRIVTVRASVSPT